MTQCRPLAGFAQRKMIEAPHQLLSPEPDTQEELNAIRNRGEGRAQPWRGRRCLSHPSHTHTHTLLLYHAHKQTHVHIQCVCVCEPLYSTLSMGRREGGKANRQTDRQERGEILPATSVASPPPCKVVCSQASLSKGVQEGHFSWTYHKGPYSWVLGFISS